VVYTGSPSRPASSLSEQPQWDTSHKYSHGTQGAVRLWANRPFLTTLPCCRSLWNRDAKSLFKPT